MFGRRPLPRSRVLLTERQTEWQNERSHYSTSLGRVNIILNRISLSTEAASSDHNNRHCINVAGNLLFSLSMELFRKMKRQPFTGQRSCNVLIAAVLTAQYGWALNPLPSRSLTIDLGSPSSYYLRYQVWSTYQNQIKCICFSSLDYIFSHFVKCDRQTYLHVLLSASLYFSKRGAYWDRLCRDVVGRWLVGWLSRACTVATNGAS